MINKYLARENHQPWVGEKMGWKDRIVALYTPTGQNDGKYGTAFPAARGLLLTARHVVRPEGRAPDQGRINVKWWNSAEGWFEADEDETLIIWENDTYDIALLSVRQPDDVRGVMSLSRREPADHMSWAGCAFPQVQVRDDQREPGDFLGKVMSMLEKSIRFTVEASSTTPAWPEGWKGASGMPIVVDNRVIGIAIEIPSGYNGVKISAAPMYKILQARGTGASSSMTLGEILYAGSVKSALLEAVRHVAVSEIRRQTLAHILNITPPDIGRNEPVPQNWLEEVIASMLDIPTGDLFARFHSWALENSALEMYELVRIIAPALFKDIGNDMSCPSGRASAAIVGLAVGTHTMAELIIAANEGRAADFHARINTTDMPPGTHLIPLSPIPRAVGDQYEILGDILEDLRKFYAVSGDHEVKGFLSKATQSLCNNTGTIYKGNVIKNLNAKFDILKKARHALPYMAFYLPDSPDQREHILDVIRSLCSDLPDLVVIALDAECIPEDYRLLGPFTHMIPISKKQG